MTSVYTKDSTINICEKKTAQNSPPTKAAVPKNEKRSLNILSCLLLQAWTATVVDCMSLKLLAIVHHKMKNDRIVL